MPSFRSRAVKRRRDGRYELHFSDELRELLRSLAGQMTELIEDEPEDPSLRRLFPTAYTDDPFRDAEYQVMSGDRLRDGRKASYEMLERVIGHQVVTDDELGALLRALNDVRLVVGTRLDVSEDDEPFGSEADPDDPADQLRWLYDVLTLVQSEVVDALSRSL